MKTLIAIYTTKNRNEYRLAIENTWWNTLDKKKFDIKFVYCSKSSEGSYTTEDAIFLANCDESYEQLPAKTYTLVKLIYKWYGNYYDSIFKCNDDIFIDGELFNKVNFIGLDYAGKFNAPISSIFEINKKRISEKIHWFKCSTEYHVKKKIYPGLKYVEGSGCYLSKQSMSILVQSEPSFWINTPETYKGEDIAIGLLLQNSESRIEKKDFKNLRIPLKCPIDMWENGTLIHPIHYSLMEPLFLLKNIDERLELIYANSHLNDYVQREKFNP